MNAPTKIILLDAALSEATEHANGWRGWMVNQFARGERMIVQTLLREGQTKIPTVLKQRTDRLRLLVNEQAGAALDRFLDLARYRTALAHGDGLVTVDRKGQWLLRLTYYDRDVETNFVLFQPEADRLREELRAATAALQRSLKANSRTSGRAGTPCA